MQDTSIRIVLAAERNGEQLVANLEKLISMAQSFDQEGLGGLSSFINNLDNLISMEIKESEALVELEDENTVKVMTIHASKGLQFPVVFVPFLNSKPGGGRDDVLVNPDMGVACKFHSLSEEELPEEHTLYRFLKLKQRQKDLAEEKRLFYVAASRASNYLILSASNPDKISKESALEWIYARFMEDGYDITLEDQIDLTDFSLIIHREMPVSAKTEGQDKLYAQNLRSIMDEVHNLKDTAQPISKYMQPISGRVTGRIFSATMIMTYLRDPEEYYNRYHLGFFEGDYELFLADKRPDDYGLILGKLVHRLLEKWPSAIENAEVLLDSLFIEYEILDSGAQKQLKSEIIPILAGLESSALAKDILNAREFRNEIAITMQIGEDYLTGTLDRLIKNADGIWEVIDYKTNRMGSKSPEFLGKHYEWQMRAYALLLSKVNPEQEFFPVTLYFIRSDQKYSYNFSKHETDQIFSDFQNIISEIKQEMPVDVEDISPSM